MEQFLITTIDTIFEKKWDKSKFSWLAILFGYFFIKIQLNMSEQEKETTKNLWFAKTPKSSQNILK